MAKTQVPGASIQDAAIDSTKIAAGAVDNAALAADAVTADKITDGTIATADIAAGAIDNAALAADAVTSDKIADGSITEADLDTTYAEALAAAAGVGNFIPFEIPAGTINGSNLDFTIAQGGALDAALTGSLPSGKWADTLVVFKDGLIMTLTDDYTFVPSTGVISFIDAPTNHVVVQYRYPSA